MKLIYNYGFADHLHWACERCIVRGMCQDDGCFLTDLFHPYCLTCKENHKCKQKCNTVLRAELFDKVESYYGKYFEHLLEKYILESSLLYQLSKTNINKSEFRLFHEI